MTDQFQRYDPLRQSIIWHFLRKAARFRAVLFVLHKFSAYFSTLKAYICSVSCFDTIDLIRLKVMHIR